jgi:hypothetical protein
LKAVSFTARRAATVEAGAIVAVTANIVSGESDPIAPIAAPLHFPLPRPD